MSSYNQRLRKAATAPDNRAAYLEALRLKAEAAASKKEREKRNAKS